MGNLKIQVASDQVAWLWSGGLYKVVAHFGFRRVCWRLQTRSNDLQWCSPWPNELFGLLRLQIASLPEMGVRTAATFSLMSSTIFWAKSGNLEFERSGEWFGWCESGREGVKKIFFQIRVKKKIFSDFMIFSSFHAKNDPMANRLPLLLYASSFFTVICSGLEFFSEPKVSNFLILVSKTPLKYKIVQLKNVLNVISKLFAAAELVKRRKKKFQFVIEKYTNRKKNTNRKQRKKKKKKIEYCEQLQRAPRKRLLVRNWVFFT